MVPNGRLYVPHSYVQTTSDVAVQLNAAADWAAQKFIPTVDFEIFSASIYITAEATQGIMDVAIYSDVSNAPDTKLADIKADLDSGGSADTWIRFTCDTNYQCQRGVPYWFVIKGEDGDDYSLSCRRWNTNAASMFPDGAVAKVSTDSGSSWSAVTEDSKAASLNIVINSSTNHVPPLMYGRYNGKYIYLPGTGVMEIPEEGVVRTCDALTAGTVYYTYAYNNSGTLALDNSTTAPTLHEGILVKTGATNYRYVGMICPKTLVSSYEGPVDVMDYRGVANAYNKIKTTWGKLAPFGTDTQGSITNGGGWQKWNGDESYLFSLLSHPNEPISLTMTSWGNGATNSFFQIGRDGATPFILPTTKLGNGVAYLVQSTITVNDLAIGGYHTYYPLYDADADTRYVKFYDDSPTMQSGVSGFVAT